MHRAEHRDQERDDGVAQELERQHGPSEQQAVDEYVESQVAEVDQVGAIPHQPARKQRAHHHLQRNVPVSFEAPEAQRQGGDEQRAGKRRQREGGARCEQYVGQLLRNEVESRRKVQSRLL